MLEPVSVHSILPELLTRAARQHALVVAGEHDYGRQLDGQLRLASLPRAERADDADLVVLAGLAGEPEIERAAATAPLPLVAFDGAEGAALGDREVRVALPFAPVDGVPTAELLAGVERAQRAAALVVRAVAEGVAAARQCSPPSAGWVALTLTATRPSLPCGCGARTPNGSSGRTARSWRERASWSHTLPAAVTLRKAALRVR